MKRLMLVSGLALLGGCATPPPVIPANALKVTVHTLEGAGIAAAAAAGAAASLSPSALPDLSPTAMAVVSGVAGVAVTFTGAVALSPTAADIAAVAPPKKFSMLALPGNADPADEKLREMFSVRLKFKGYQLDDGSPQLRVTCAHSLSPSAQLFTKLIRVKVYAADATPLISPTALPLWEGEAHYTDAAADILAAAPLLLQQLSEEIPSPSGKGETRYVVP